MAPLLYSIPKPPPPPPRFGSAKGSFKLAGATPPPAANWREILRKCGFPQDVVVLDWETYFDSEYGIRSLSTVEYITAPQFEELGVSVLRVPADAPFIDYEQQTQWWDGESGVRDVLEYLRGLYGPHLERCTVVAQNARFDGSVLSFRHGIRPPHVVDTLGLARHWDARNRNDLDSLTKRFELVEKGETSKFKGWSNRVRFAGAGKNKTGPKLPVPIPAMTAQQKRALAEYANNDVMREWECFTRLLPLLSRPEIELPLINHTLGLFFNPRLNVDSVRAAELRTAMQSRLDTVLQESGLTPTQIRGRFFDDRLDARLQEVEGPLITGEDPVKWWRKPAKCKQGWKITSAANDPERERLLVHPDSQVRTMMQAKEALHSWPNHIGRVARIVNQAAASPNGCLPVPLKYYGAITGRWSGDEKINLQNLGERNPEPLIRAVRELITAPPGKTLIIVDLSAIEGRGTGWIARETRLLQQFRDQDANPLAVTDVYTAFATDVLGYPVRKPKKSGGIPAIESRMKWARNSVGKVGVLGCGYGMGATKAEAYAGGAIDFLTAQRIVETYRAKNANIVQFWKDIERAFIYTARYQRPCELPLGLRFETRPNCDVVMVLPNGRELKYHHVRVTPGDKGWGETASVFNPRDKAWTRIWGGFLTENCVQGFCRDILAEALLRCEARGVPIVLHVHDELVALGDSDKGRAEETLRVMIEELTRPLPWALDFPLAAEGLVTPRYGGH